MQTCMRSFAWALVSTLKNFCTCRIWILFYSFSIHFISNINDKRQITGTYCVSLKGEFLPPQLIYQGKTPAYYPKHVKFPDGFHITQTENHWSNERVHLAYLKKTIIFHIEKVRKQLNLQEDHKALLIYDVFKGQTTGAVSELLEKKNIISKKVPTNKTNLFQLLDLSANKSPKCFLSDKFQTWYADQVAARVGRGVVPHDVKVDVQLLVVKPLHAK